MLSNLAIWALVVIMPNGEAYIVEHKVSLSDCYMAQLAVESTAEGLRASTYCIPTGEPV